MNANQKKGLRTFSQIPSAHDDALLSSSFASIRVHSRSYFFVVMQLKEYQTETLKAVRVYLEALAELRAKDTKARSLDPELGIDWPAKAWEKMETGRTYFPRRNGLREPLPVFCLKIPTGGGKTLLAIKTIDLVNTYLRRSNRDWWCGSCRRRRFTGRRSRR